MTEYYVATTGNNGDAGTIGKPWATITYAASVIAAYDTVHVRGGTYHEKLTISPNNVTFAAYEDETPIIDGRRTLPTSWDYLVTLAGAGILFKGFEVKESAWLGIGVGGSGNTVRDCYVHHTYDGGIYVYGPNAIVEDCETYWCSDKREYGRGSGYWSWGICANNTSGTIIRRNYVHQIWGEGIGPYIASNLTIEDNVIADCYAVGLYLNRIQIALIQRNLIYGIPGSDVWNTGYRAPGIGIADEGPAGQNTGLIIINNIVHDTLNHAIYFWPDAAGSGLKNSLIAFNSVDMRKQDRNAIQINAGSHSNSRITSNIALGGVSIAPGITVDNNMTTGNPLWVGGVAPDGYKISSGSPAIGAAATDTGVVTDYWVGKRGGNPDQGACEYTTTNEEPDEESEEDPIMGAVQDLQIAVDILTASVAVQQAAFAQVENANVKIVASTTAIEVAMAALQAADVAADALADAL